MVATPKELYERAMSLNDEERAELAAGQSLSRLLQLVVHTCVRNSRARYLAQVSLDVRPRRGCCVVRNMLHLAGDQVFPA